MKIAWKLIVVLLLVVPVGLAIAWLTSGRENLTKTVVYVQQEVEDDLFGTDLRSVGVPGPFLGYYIGLDAVGLSAAVSAITLATSGVVAAIKRRRARRGALEELA